MKYAWLIYGVVPKRILLQSCIRSPYSRYHTLCTRYDSPQNGTESRTFGYIPHRSETIGSPQIKTVHESNEVSAAGLDLSSFKDSRDQGIARLIEAYRIHGHKKADINPLQEQIDLKCEELNPNNYGLTLDAEVTLADGHALPVSDLVEHLENVFCGTLSIETGHIASVDEKEFFCQAFIEEKSAETNIDEKKRIAELMIKSEAFDHFVHTKFKTVKRYSGQGAESAAVFSNEIFKISASTGTHDVIIGMPHRGRLNLLATQLKLEPEIIFRKMKGFSEFPDEIPSVATGDVLSHLTTSCDLQFENGNVHITMLPCPSHLERGEKKRICAVTQYRDSLHSVNLKLLQFDSEAVNPVAMGKCRARQQTLSGSLKDFHGDPTKALCFLMHGDAAIAGQGIVAECFNMSNLPHFSVGGSIHLIVNNQLGFTTPASKGRSSLYASDVAKLVGCPVLHVNGDYPEDVARAARIALKYRNMFARDVVVDLVCYRQWGHNEMDDPSFTQPLMYRNIESRTSPPEVYATRLVNSAVLSPDDIAHWKTSVHEKLSEHLNNAETFQPPPTYLQKQWSGLKFGSVSELTQWDTGVPVDNLRYLGMKSVEVPDNMDMHSRLVKMYADSRKEKMASMAPVDWATAEALSFGSLLQQGFDVRICGQDVGRGTFSQRHASVICQDSERAHIPLNHLFDDQHAKIEVVNSLLSEEAVLGFEYGITVESPNRLVIWEAQFGDFFNGAQIIIDAFISSGEAKWLLQSGLVMLLPHGYDGMGPEHSSCRIERFLQGTNSKEDGIDGDGVNMHICHPTTPAQYFHLLRRQMIRNYRKPLIVASPKTLLRLPAASSPLSDMAPGTSFQPILTDPMPSNKEKVKTLLFCSGKHYYSLVDERNRLGLDDTVCLIRLEELCPFPSNLLRKEILSFNSVTSYVWAQEEPQNMGAWSFVSPRFQNILGIKLKYAGRPVLPAPAVGIGLWHKKQMEQILADAFRF